MNPHCSLLLWYETNGRHHLPWRTSNDPYHIYLSEIMLQQTQVKTVLERFYFPFLERFPTLYDVAVADLDDVLKQWEGLGYYTRARNLHRSAQQCHGILPDNADELRQLPGVGRSTAHAVAAFAYKESLPILDANVKRILHRFFAYTQRDEKKLWEYAYTLFDPEHPFEFNQAMMDLGSMVCTSKNPLCSDCPFEPWCEGKQNPLAYPEPKIKKTKPVRPRNILIYHHNGSYALIQRKERFLNGLWGFLQTTLSPPSSAIFLGHITQHYSHFTLEAETYLFNNYESPEEAEWFTLSELQSLSLSRADHKAIALLRYNLEKEEG